MTNDGWYAQEQKKAQWMLFKLHRCLRLALTLSPSETRGGDNLAVHVNTIADEVSKANRKGQMLYNPLVDAWCDVFLETYDPQYNDKPFARSRCAHKEATLDGLKDQFEY